jgi:hypothetical protein
LPILRALERYREITTDDLFLQIQTNTEKRPLVSLQDFCQRTLILAEKALSAERIMNWIPQLAIDCQTLLTFGQQRLRNELARGQASRLLADLLDLAWGKDSSQVGTRSLEIRQPHQPKHHTLGWLDILAGCQRHQSRQPQRLLPQPH